jgi:hypothetical protein
MTLSTAFLLCLGVPLTAAELYFTDFENFTVGDNRWANTDGWVSNDTTSGAQGIDQDLIIGGGLGKTASLGFNRPANTTTTVARPVSFNPATTGVTVVEIDTLLGIEDSTTLFRDDFYLSLYNGGGSLLASIRFDNQSPSAIGSQFGIWREDGLYQFDTGIDFIHGEIFNLYARIDLAANTWSADIDGVPLFTDAPFTATPAALNLGYLAFEWKLTSTLTTLSHGDNFLLVADIAVRSVPTGAEPFTATLAHAAGGDDTLAWPADPGFIYQVEYSTDLATWFDDLPGSEFTAGTTPSTMTYVAAPAPPPRFYRVRRTETP